MERLYQGYKDQAAFLFVYIREAHAEDEWQMSQNETQGVVFSQPKTFDERVSVARQCCSRLKLSMPCVVDTIDDQVDNLYAGWPERMFVIGADGKVAYAGRQGPWGFVPEEVEAWLKSYKKGSATTEKG